MMSANFSEERPFKSAGRRRFLNNLSVVGAAIATQEHLKSPTVGRESADSPSPGTVPRRPFGRRTLYSIAIRILNDSQSAEDVLQEVFVEIWNTASTFDRALGRPLSWALKITCCKPVERMRTRERSNWLLARTANSAINNESAGTTYLEETFGREQTTLVLTALMELPAYERRPIELAFWITLLITGLQHHS